MKKLYVKQRVVHSICIIYIIIYFQSYLIIILQLIEMFMHVAYGSDSYYIYPLPH